MKRKTIHIELCIPVHLELVVEEDDGDVRVAQVLNVFPPSPRLVMESMADEDWQTLEKCFMQ